MKRSDVLQQLLKRYDDPSYLEVGVDRGDTFNALYCNRKVAVDPGFSFNISESDKDVTYHRITSDEYFSNKNLIEKFDLIYLDGLHTFSQTLRDYLNSIQRLNSKGVIVIDDVLPDSYHASLPDHSLSIKIRTAIGSQSKSWMGDVYRLVLFVESFVPQYSYATIADNHGQLVVWPELRKNIKHRNVEDVSRAPYEVIFTERDSFNILPFSKILELLDNV